MKSNKYIIIYILLCGFLYGCGHTKVLSTDDIKNYILKNPERTTPKFNLLGKNNKRIFLLQSQREHGVLAYRFSWPRIDIFKNIEITFDTISFKALIDEKNEFDAGRLLKDNGIYCYKDSNDQTVCLINEDMLGRRCISAGYGQEGDEMDCKACRNACVYRRDEFGRPPPGNWGIRARGYSNNIYGNYSDEWILQLRCSNSEPQ